MARKKVKYFLFLPRRKKKQLLEEEKKNYFVNQNSTENYISNFI